jgi:hypothetical protein
LKWTLVFFKKKYSNFFQISTAVFFDFHKNQMIFKQFFTPWRIVQAQGKHRTRDANGVLGYWVQPFRRIVEAQSKTERVTPMAFLATGFSRSGPPRSLLPPFLAPF